MKMRPSDFLFHCFTQKDFSSRITWWPQLNSLSSYIKVHSFNCVYYPFLHLFTMVGSFLKRPRTPPTNNSAMDYQTADFELALRRSRPLGIPEEVLYKNVCPFCI